MGKLLLEDILSQLARPGRDPREDLPAPAFKRGILKLEDLTPAMELTGTVLNVVDFGAFVDIGLHDSGLVHVSQLADKYIPDPHDVVAVGNIVKVWVVSINRQRRRVSLTMIPPGTERAERPKPRQAAKPAAAEERATRGRQPSAGKRPKPKGPPRGKAKRPPRQKYKPKPPRKPVVPITEEMKAGSEPMRTFGDLAQFFENRTGEPSDGDHKDEAAGAKDDSHNVSDHAQTPNDDSQNADRP